MSEERGVRGCTRRHCTIEVEMQLSYLNQAGLYMLTTLPCKHRFIRFALMRCDATESSLRT